MLKKLSIIIPVYNGEKTINRCLTSIMGQSYTNLEIVVVDDGSKDRTKNIIAKLASSDPRIHYYRKENGGAASARNVGLNSVSGEYITFLDSDDYIEPDTYLNMIGQLENMHLDMVSSSIREIYDGDIIQLRVNEDNQVIDGAEALCKMFSFEGGIRTVVWDKIYRRSIIEQIRFQENLPYGEDTLFNCKAMVKVRRYGRIAYVGYTYDHRESKMTSNTYHERFMCNVDVIKGMQVVIDKELLNNLCYSKVNKYLMLYRIEIYRDLFHKLLSQGWKDISKQNYILLRDNALKIPNNSLKTNLSFKHRIQWFLYLYCFSVYHWIFHMWRRVFIFNKHS